jgi:pimeloyl-ACP methyl ester carboxylesterase
MATDYVFLHGGGQGGWIWDETVEALTAQAPGELPGCGAKRGRSTEALNFAEIIAELAADVRAAGVRDALLVGHSQAGTVMPALQAAAPEAFRRAVYVSCCAPAPGQTVASMMGTSRHGENPDEVGWPVDPKTTPLDKRFAAMFCNDMASDQASAFLARLGFDAWPACAAIESGWRYGLTPQIAATYVVCLDDGILTVPWQRRFAERFGVDAVVEVQGGHQVMNTRPQSLAEILRFEARR